MTKDLRHADGGVWYEANSGVLCNDECMKPDQCPVDGALAQFDTRQRHRLASETGKVAKVGIAADQVDLIDRHRVVRGEDAGVVIGPQPDEIARRRDGPNTIDGRGPETTNDPNHVGCREEWR